MNRNYPIMKSMNILNALLLLAVIAAANAVVVPFLSLQIAMVLPAAGKAETKKAATPASRPNPYLADYLAVSEQNLFHPERKIPLGKKEEIAVAPPKPDLVLYGTLIMDNQSIAYIEDRKAPSPYSTPGRGKRQTQLRKGESVNGYVLQEIEANRIVLVKGEEKLVVLLNDPGKRKTAEAAPALSGLTGMLSPMSATPGTSPAQASSLTVTSSSSAAAPATFRPPTAPPARVASPGSAPAVDAQATDSPPLTRRQRVQLLQQEKANLRIPAPTVPSP